MLGLRNSIYIREIRKNCFYTGFVVRRRTMENIMGVVFGIELEIEKYTDKYYICTYVSRTNNFVLKHCVMLDDFLWFVFIFRLFRYVCYIYYVCTLLLSV